MPKKQVQPTIFVLKMSCTPSRKWPFLYYSSFLCVLHFNVVFLLCRSFPFIFDAFPGFVFFLNRFMNFEQRYATVALIYAVNSNLFQMRQNVKRWLSTY